MTKEEIVVAIRQTGAELGRAPSRGELRRITGVSHYRVLSQFRTLREAVRAAGLEPNPKGEKISTEELIRDWKRVGKKLGRRPSRAEYVRAGRYSAGALVGRFGSWGQIGEKTYHRDTEARRTAKEGGRELTRNTRMNESRLPELPKVPKNPKFKVAKAAVNKRTIEMNGAGSRESSDKAIAFQWAAALAAIPGPLEGKRRVTEAVAAMVVNTLLGDSSNWQFAVGESRRINHEGHEGAQRQHNQESYSSRSLAVTARLIG